MITTQRGFTLLISILLATVAVTLGASLLDIAYKQVILSSTAKQSQYAFYAADSAMECALYWDQKYNAFQYYSPLPSASITCQNNSVIWSGATVVNGSPAYRKTDFAIRCGGTNTSNARVSIYKYTNGQTTIYANGFNNCDANDARRVERGFEVFY